MCGNIFDISIHIKNKRVFCCAMWKRGFWIGIFHVGLWIRKSYEELPEDKIFPGLSLFGWTFRTKYPRKVGNV